LTAILTKHISRAGKSSSFARLVYYITAEMEKENRVAQVRFSGLDSFEVKWAIHEVKAVQDKNTSARTDKTYHLLISFRQGVNPPIEVLHDIEDRIVEAIGFGDCQRVSAIHTDTDDLHIHVAINRIHPHTGAVIVARNDYKIMRKVAQDLAIEYGLEINAQQEQQAEQLQTSSQKDTTQNISTNTKPSISKSQQNKLNRLQRELDINAQIEALGANQDKAAKQNKTNKKRKSMSANKAADFEAHTGLASLISWTKEEVLPSLKTAASWQQVHQIMQDNGLLLRLKGNGLGILAHDGTVCKPSDVDRSLSKSALEKRLGEFESSIFLDDFYQQAQAVKPAKKKGNKREPSKEEQSLKQARKEDLGRNQYQQQAQKAQAANDAGNLENTANNYQNNKQQRTFHKKYQAQPVKTSVNSSRLWQQYQATTADIKNNRKIELAKLKREQTMQLNRVEREYQLDGLFASLSESLSTLNHTNNKPPKYLALREVRERFKGRRQAIYAKYKHYNWVEFLRIQAIQGDEEALKILQARKERHQDKQKYNQGTIEPANNNQSTQNSQSPLNQQGLNQTANIRFTYAKDINGNPIIDKADKAANDYVDVSKFRNNWNFDSKNNTPIRRKINWKYQQEEQCSIGPAVGKDSKQSKTKQNNILNRINNPRILRLSCADGTTKYIRLDVITKNGTQIYSAENEISKYQQQKQQRRQLQQIRFTTINDIYFLKKPANTHEPLNNVSAIRDDGEQITITKNLNQQSAQVALHLAQVKFGNYLDVRGSKQFKAQMILAAVNTNPEIVFTDPKMEGTKQQLIKKKEQDERNRARRDQQQRNYQNRQNKGNGKNERNGAGRTADGRSGEYQEPAEFRADESNLAAIIRGQTATALHDLPTLSERNMGSNSRRAKMLLQDDVHTKLQQRQSNSDHSLRRQSDNLTTQIHNQPKNYH